ncbi:MAG: oligosaccharyl transferase subunit ost3/OST6 [Candelina mexicana]|nr:MAG: oligosaccharyl transferase subunit ost3/OST6 [Candelina mexicana]
MRLLNVFTFSIFSLTALAAKKTAVDKYQEYHSRALSSTPLRLDDALYDHLTASPRNHTLAVLLTALETKYGCALCREFQPEWDLIARSWLKGDKTGQSRVLYGTLDFADGRGVFQRLMLQTAPVLLLFQPTVGPNAKLDGQPIRYDFNNGPQSAEQVYAYIARHVASDVRPPIVRPVNYIRIVAVTTAVLGLISFFSVASPYILPIIQNRNLWAAISLIAVLLFTSGHMFNHIRKVPYVAGDGKGGVSYFAGGFSNQFGLETQIIAAMYGVLSFATISLALKVPRMADPRSQQVAVFVWGFVMLGMYSFLLNVFRVKNGGYPFWLPPF